MGAGSIEHRRVVIDKKRIYDLVSQIPKGRVSTYGLLANAIGRPRVGRAIGKLLSRNPNPITVPCHRIICSDGRVGGYSKGVKEKIRLLNSEGVTFNEGIVNNFREIIFRDLAET